MSQNNVKYSNDVSKLSWITCLSNKASNSQDHVCQQYNSMAKFWKSPLTWERQDKNVRNDGLYTDLGCNVKHHCFARTQKLPELMKNEILSWLWSQQEMKYIFRFLWRTTNNVSLYQICFQFLTGFQKGKRLTPHSERIHCVATHLFNHSCLV